ncbi:MAG: 2-oxo acid dehydrogenase subunit E2 [Clostridia bacterium]|nr:2-oxo acid dehydrogenase subunit E2 [Clostridia bacterium]
MGIYNRADGKYIKELPTYIKFFPFIMRKRLDASVYFSQKIDLSKTMEYMKEHDVKIFHIFIAALLKLGIEKPVFNRFVVGKRVYQRKDLVIGFMAKQALDEKSKEISVKVYFEKTDKLDDVKRKVQEKVDIVKNKGEFNVDSTIDTLMALPKWMTTLIFFVIRKIDHLGLLSKKFIDDNPMYVSAYVTNVGSIGLDAPFHHMYEWGTTSIFAALGKIHKDYIIDDNSQMRITDVANINFTIDERIADGIYMAKALNDFKSYMENPSLLE